jgi:peroxiredoxin
MQPARCWLAALTAGVLFCSVALAQEAARPKDDPGATGTQGQRTTGAPAAPKVGDAAPDFELKGVDGKTYRLADYKDKIVVLEWMNQDCPFSNYAQGAGPRIKALSEKYKEKGVVWLAIDSTHYQTAEKDAAYAKENKIPHPVLMDSDGKVGRAYGARTTPHVFVLNKGKLAYSGALDNNPRHEKNKPDYRGYVDEALGALLAGKEVPLASTESWGCSVKYKDKK